ncbi:hypothetical protein CEUSTIGMA_g1301.t1 [Chlamydomonas eustigma]|uniref:Uncharacterized protein n=1 Tax=Chlamydomonas eustigma TaxID=1157962 RepID=A0A250WSS8_9CHLO|nr:hypothetical protein CEUSTIGMA_g1301.t1 [Chlamydomonas eustigma]|eukprot:GAX73851.1 hypothetical protein CEUSTIGMA_g1301.t1 [Chlamydomonas eustigma]
MDPLSLLMFARDNKYQELEAAITLGFSPDTGNQMGQTAMHIAALWGSYEVAEKLIQLGANVNVENTRGQTPLHFAASARKRAKEICTLLLKHGAATDVMDSTGRVAYEMADDDEIRTLLGGPDGRLFSFASEGKVAELQLLLSDGSIKSVKVLDSKGRTPLNIAVTKEHLEVVQALLSFDPTCLDVPDSGGDTALHCATDVSNSKILTYLLSLKPDLNIQNLNPSEYAAGNWILHGEAIMPVDKTALHLAVENGDVAVVTMLLEAGADPNILDFDKRSALHLALEQLDVPLVELLLAHKADPNQTSQDFVSPLHFAAQRGPARLLQALLDRGGDPRVVNEDGWAPLHLAARSGNAEKARLLLAAQAPVSAPNTQQGNTPLHLAAINGHLQATQVLLEYSADKAAVNKEGKRPTDVAKTPEVTAMLGV